MQAAQIPVYIRIVFILLLIMVIVHILIVGKNLLIPLFLSGLLSMLLTPLCIRMENWKIPRVISALIALLSCMVVLAGLVFLIILQIKGASKDFEGVSQRMNDYLSDLDGFLSDNLGIELGIQNGLDKSYLTELMQSNSETISQFLFNTIGSLAGVVLTPVFIFFMLIYRYQLGNFIAQLFKSQEEKKVKEEIVTIRKMVQGYVIGLLKVMAVLAVLNTGALYALGIKHALFFGLFAAFLNIIPYLGPFLGAILPFIYAFLTADTLFQPIAVVVLFTIIQLIESNFLTPKIVGSNVNLNAFITLIGLLIGGAIWGIIGMILIIPTLAILRRIFELSPSTKPFAYLLGEEISPHEKEN